mmetsp:Transcript_27918/g.55972  ORF Transcript_27918/g.55972 Transcript_27918/m.55972 type:complete len:95 (+) Transcript_27918:424-708(+)
MPVSSLEVSALEVGGCLSCLLLVLFTRSGCERLSRGEGLLVLACQEPCDPISSLSENTLSCTKRETTGSVVQAEGISHQENSTVIPFSLRREAC